MRRTLLTTGLLAAICFACRGGVATAQDTNNGKTDEGTLDLAPLEPVEQKATQPEQRIEDQPTPPNDGPSITPMTKVGSTNRPDLPALHHVDDDGEDWEIHIVSLQAMNGEPVRRVVQPNVVIQDPKGGPVITPGPISPSQYERIYSSIPFRRSEYRANPSYRHDSTMEIMFGQLRPTVIHRHSYNPSSQVQGTTVREYRTYTLPHVPRYNRFGLYPRW